VKGTLPLLEKHHQSLNEKSFGDLGNKALVQPQESLVSNYEYEDVCEAFKWLATFMSH